MNQTFYGVDTAGLSKIETAMNNYIKAIQAADLGVTASVAKAYAQGSASATAITNGFGLIEKTIDTQIKSQLGKFYTRAKEQMKAYEKFDATAANDTTKAFKTANTKIENSLKS